MSGFKGEFEILDNIKLLKNSGSINQTGWAKEQLVEYNIDQYAYSKKMLKSWDRYIIQSNNTIFTLSLIDLGYCGILSYSFCDIVDSKCDNMPKSHLKKLKLFEDGKSVFIDHKIIIPFSLGRLNAPISTKNGSWFYNTSKLSIILENANGKRSIKLYHKNYARKNGCSLNISACINIDKSDDEQLVLVSPYSDKKDFMFSQKISAIPCSGYIDLGINTFNFDKSNSFATLDWHRGSIPNKQTFYKAMAQGKFNKHRYALNLANYTKTKTDAKEDNILYNGKINKLDGINFSENTNIKSINKDIFLNDWKFNFSNISTLTFKPVYNRKCNYRFFNKWIKQNQVYGLFSGQIILDDGSILDIKSRLGICEKLDLGW